MEVASGDDAVAFGQLVGLDVVPGSQAVVDRREILVAVLKQLSRSCRSRNRSAGNRR